MTEQELVILFTACALAGVAMNVDRPHSIEWCAQHAVRLAVASVAELKNNGFNWPEPIVGKEISTVPARDTTTTASDKEREMNFDDLGPAT